MSQSTTAPSSGVNPPPWIPVDASCWGRVKEALHHDWEESREHFSRRFPGEPEPRSGERDAAAGRGDDVADWRWEDDGSSAEQAMRYGFAARVHFASWVAWNEEVEAFLGREWRCEWGPSWEQARGDVRRGWQSACQGA
jgi:hypothetical protein